MYPYLVVKDPAVGLCSDCQHCRNVKSQRSTFYMCLLSFTNPEYRKYPPLPVLRCAGYRPAPDESRGFGRSEAAGLSDKLAE